MNANVEIYCRQAAKEWQRSKDAALLELSRLPPPAEGVSAEIFNFERFLVEQRIATADGMIRWFLGGQGEKFLWSTIKTA